MSKLLLIFGITGQQGGSVANYVLNDPELSQQYKVRGITRQSNQQAAKKWRDRGVEIVYGDVDDEKSLMPALKGAHAVFSVTITIYDKQTKAREIRHGKAIADAAVASGAQYLIFSSLPSPARISNGKYKVPGFDAKGEVEDYIRSLPIKSSFFAPASFMENYHEVFIPRPTQDGSGTYNIATMMKPDVPIPHIAAILDSGKYVGAILADPDKYEGKTFSAATTFYTFNEVVEAMSKACGKTVKYVQLPVDVFRSFMPPERAEVMVDMVMYFEEYGLYGPNAKRLVEWTAKQARGKLTTLDEYFKLNPLQLA